ncbi:MAG: hypothetical protein ACP5N9_04395 [Candidatus Bilamarchaeum sp.]
MTGVDNLSQIEISGEILSKKFDLTHLVEFSYLLDHKPKAKTKQAIVQELLVKRKERVEEFLENLEKLKGCSKEKILTEIYQFSTKLGKELSAHSKLTKPIIVLELMKAKLIDKIEIIAILTKITRSVSYFPRKFVGKLRSDLDNTTKISAEITSRLIKYNNDNHNKTELDQYLFIKNEGKLVVAFRQELGKRIYTQLSMRGEKKITAYPTRVKIIDFNYNKNEILSNLLDDDILLKLAIGVLTGGDNSSLDKIMFIQPADEDELKKTLEDKIDGRKNELRQKTDSVSQKEIEVLDQIKEFKRTKIQLKNVPIAGNLKNMLFDADDADESLIALGVSKERIKELTKKSESYEFAIQYKGTKITVAPAGLIIKKGKTNISDLELNILIQLLKV